MYPVACAAESGGGRKSGKPCADDDYVAHSDGTGKLAVTRARRPPPQSESFKIMITMARKTTRKTISDGVKSMRFSRRAGPGWNNDENPVLLAKLWEQL
jgi:hypothetical protein